MAKQTGLHQIRGKVGEHSYYRQSGVSSGLIRGINQGLSSRVKTAPEYANTRLNNKEFKTASRLAASMISGVIPRWRPMFNMFKNAKLSASLLEIIKSHPGVWGKRAIGFSDRLAASVAVNKLAKNNLTDYFDLTFGLYDEQNDLQPVSLSVSESFADYLRSIGASGCTIVYRHVQIYEGQPTDDEMARLENVVVTGPASEMNVALANIPTTLTDEIDHLDTNLMLLSGRILLSFYVGVILPYRTVGETDHILQEGCSFGYVPDPQQVQ